MRKWTADATILDLGAERYRVARPVLESLEPISPPDRVQVGGIVRGYISGISKSDAPTYRSTDPWRLELAKLMVNAKMLFEVDRTGNRVNSVHQIALVTDTRKVVEALDIWRARQRVLKTTLTQGQVDQPLSQLDKQLAHLGIIQVAKEMELFPNNLCRWQEENVDLLKRWQELRDELSTLLVHFPRTKEMLDRIIEVIEDYCKSREGYDPRCILENIRQMGLGFVKIYEESTEPPYYKLPRKIVRYSGRPYWEYDD